MKHTITITKEDFLNNPYEDHLECPLAIALKRHFPNAESISVGGWTFTILGLGGSNITKNMEVCRIENQHLHHTDILSELIADYALTTTRYLKQISAQDVTFNFITC